MTKVNMILVLSLVSQLLVGSVYSTRTDSTLDQLKETAYNSFGTVKDFAGNSMESVKDTASEAIGSVKNKVWPSYAPADAPATSPHHGGHHNQHNHHHKFHADAPVPISTTGKHGFADDSAGSMHETKQVHKVTIHTSMHGFLPGNKAYNDVTGDPDRAVKEWGKGSGYTGAHRHDKGKWASAPKSSTMQERILRESYKQKAHHTPSPAPTKSAHQKAHDGSGEKIHTTIHTASHKFDDVTGDATSTFHNWAKDGHGHGKAAPVPKSSATHNRRLGESHHGKATPGKHSSSPSPAPTNAADHSNDKHKPYAKSPSPKTSGDYADAILHNTIHTAVNHKFSDVTGDATATFHDWAKDGHYKGGAASPKSSTKHVQGHGRGLGESHKGKRTAHKHPHTPSSAPTIAAGPEHHKSTKSQDDSHKRIHGRW